METAGTVSAAGMGAGRGVAAARAGASGWRVTEAVNGSAGEFQTGTFMQKKSTRSELGSCCVVPEHYTNRKSKRGPDHTVAIKCSARRISIKSQKAQRDAPRDIFSRKVAADPCLKQYRVAIAWLAIAGRYLSGIEPFVRGGDITSGTRSDRPKTDLVDAVTYSES